MSLEFETAIPEDVRPGAPVIILLHGRGSDRFDLLRLREGLPADAMVVTPQAPFPAAPWGYGPGWAWYRYLGEDRPEPEDFSRSQEMLGEFIRALPRLLPVTPGPVVLGGFSQGGTMSVSHALRSPGTIGNVLNFSGFVADHPQIPVTPEAVAGTRFFWGHGVDDQNIPLPMAEAGRSKLRDAGADLEARNYEIGHWIDSAELADASEWLDRGLDREPPITDPGAA